MNKLSPQEVLTYAHEMDCAVLVAPDQTQHEIYKVMYKEPLYGFRKNLFEDFVTLDISSPAAQVFEENDVIHFLVNGETWILQEADTEYIINHINTEEKPHDYQVKAFIKKATELETSINQYLGIRQNSEVKVLVRFQAELSIDEEEYLEGASGFHHYSYYYKIHVVDEDCNDLTGSGIYLGMITEDDRAIRELTRELIRNLLPLKERYRFLFP